MQPPNPQPANSTPKPKSSKTGLKNLLLTVALFAAAILVALFLTTFVFQQYQVDGPSMETTLNNQDRLIVYKVDRTWSKITGHPYIPNRGDIIIFNEAGLYSASGVQEKQLIKRVVGLPGDRVVVKNGTLTVYNSKHPNGFDPDTTLPYGKVIKDTTGSVDVVVPANQVFVCGDNRPDSLDSRYFGTVPVSNIIGKLVLRIYPFNSISAF
ncbi:MAG TPA: signal peptidase I [Candidatus Saccharimonadales bacterium]|nr:signal peptidase I [Candidatus Saccharimonadales bacterium]